MREFTRLEKKLLKIDSTLERLEQAGSEGPILASMYQCEVLFEKYGEL